MLAAWTDALTAAAGVSQWIQVARFTCFVSYLRAFSHISVTDAIYFTFHVLLPLCT